ncbi:hypothetical protein [Alicyclobacillus sp. SO9]|uniref:hypothetical protein n=1 Tax=Alicyclobacillus sp. SO9 TaxID=2665646 RepID=UPI0018E82B84|nr:hypothetical protein [Alicyclobacillus sp. SO9]QQE77198.1 hypothetical protein GI364_14620 [Alicyclobacillus sp. SO9]
MRNMHNKVFGIAATLVACAAMVGCTESPSPRNQAAAKHIESTGSASVTSPIVFYVPYALPAGMVLKRVTSSSSQLLLDYAKTGYTSGANTTLSIREKKAPHGRISASSKDLVGLSQGLKGYYFTTSGGQAVIQQQLLFIIPTRLTHRPSVIVTMRCFEPPTAFSKSQVIEVANEVLKNAKMNAGF